MKWKRMSTCFVVPCKAGLFGHRNCCLVVTKYTSRTFVLLVNIYENSSKLHSLKISCWSYCNIFSFWRRDNSFVAYFFDLNVTATNPKRNILVQVLLLSSNELATPSEIRNFQVPYSINWRFRTLKCKIHLAAPKWRFAGFCINLENTNIECNNCPSMSDNETSNQAPEISCIGFFVPSSVCNFAFISWE